MRVLGRAEELGGWGREEGRAGVGGAESVEETEASLSSLVVVMVAAAAAVVVLVVLEGGCSGAAGESAEGGAASVLRAFLHLGGMFGSRRVSE